MIRRVCPVFLTDFEAELAVREFSESFRRPEEVVEHYEGVFLHRAIERRLLTEAQLEESMWAAVRTEASAAFPMIDALRRGGFLSSPQVGWLHGDLLRGLV